MLKKLSAEQISEILKKLPEDLGESFFSVGTADKIREVCEKYEITGSKISFVVNYVGQVLLGMLSPEDVGGLLEKESGLKKSAAQNASQQLYRYIFFPVKESLSALSGTAKAEITQPTAEKNKQGKETLAPSPKKPDIYHEPIE